MADRNWGCITSGATFESLATTLVFFEDGRAALFGRRGKDGGQDARSSDGTRVFQAKHHQDGSAAKAIADAKNEAAKIAKYRTPGDSREPQWRGVTHWRLVTNATFNPTDRQSWDNDVVPVFSAQGLVADYWEQANLDALLEKHPEVDRAYFHNQTRAFLTLAEVHESLPSQEPFLRRDAIGAFFGREAEVEAVRAFLGSDRLFLVVHGSGGIGKTRLVVEAGERIEADSGVQVLWANVASMEASGTWFDAIVSERPTLLIVDEPEDDGILRVLAEQLGRKLGRAPQWKIAITVRSPKDPVLKFLFGPRMKPRVDELCVSELFRNEAESMCADLIGSGTLSNSAESWRATAAGELAKRFSSYPVWMTLAVHVLETTGDLGRVPATAEDLAEQYLSEVIGRQSSLPPETVLQLLRWVALVGTLNREDDAAIELIAGQTRLKSADAAKVALASLVSRRALQERGARNRFVEVKPDVLRDHLLLKWLTVDVGFGVRPVQASDDATLLARAVLQSALAGTLNRLDRAVLLSLARTELVLSLSDQALHLLDSFLDGVLRGIDSTSASARVAVAKAFVDIAPYRPEDTVRLSRVLRTTSCAVEEIGGIFGTRRVGQDDVLLELAWPVFHAALGARSPGARELVLAELCELAHAEALAAGRLEPGLPNDGKRARDLVTRALEGGPQFWSDFEDAAVAVASRLLDEVSRLSPSAGRVEVLNALLKPATAIERRQTWSEGFTIHIQTSMTLPGHPAWNTRVTLKAMIRALLERDETPPATRLTLWPLFAEAHRSVNHCWARAPEGLQATLQQELVDDLSWAHSVLARRIEDLGEVSSARALWDWHVRFEKNPDLRRLAEALEAIYAGNELAAEFEWLLSRDEWKARGARAADKAGALAPGGLGAIDAFLGRAGAFFDNERELYQVFNVAWELGARAEEFQGVRDFILAALGESRVAPRADFAAIAATSWAAARRRQDPDSARVLLAQLVDACNSDAQRINLLLQVYGRLPRRKDMGRLTDGEFLFIRSQEGLFIGAGRGAEFVGCVAWGLEFDAPALQALVERVLNEVPDVQVVAALTTLVDALYWALDECDAARIPPGLSVWMLDQLLRVPDIDSLGGNLEWHIAEVIKRTGRAPLTWLADALRRRRDLEAERGHGGSHAISYHMRVSRFVSAVGHEGEVDEGTRSAVRELVDLVSDTGSVGYYLHAVLRDIDPHGRVVPEEVARRFSEADDHEAEWRLARIGGGFAIGSEAWRTIAKPVLIRAARAEIEQRRSLWAALTDHGPRTFSGVPGEVPSMFTAAVESARRHLEAETDSDFVPFWEWRLAVAAIELRDEEEHAKEVRGE